MTKKITFTLFLVVSTTLPAQYQYFTDYQHFTNHEVSGGGPGSGSYVSFGSGDSFDGPVRTNGTLRMSYFGCPIFNNNVFAANGIDFMNCGEGIINGGWTDSAAVIPFPSQSSIQNIVENADYIFTADDLLGSPMGTDTLIMTEIEFVNNGFSLKQWPYIIPPTNDDTVPFNDFAYYHSHPNDSTSKCKVDGFHHFDFEPSPDSTDIIIDTIFYELDPSVIYVRNGQVRVKGIVYGQFTIITDDSTLYRRNDDSSRWDCVWNNIWITDDLIYEDSDSLTGEVVYGSSNRLGLLSGANIILANTEENGARNSQNGEDILVNAALLANYGSVVTHYWQNTIVNPSLNGPNFTNPVASLGDGRGPYRNPNSISPYYTANSDIRGDFIFWGSMTQNKRGYLKRNAPGPYNVIPGIGYERDLHYDYNLMISTPPGFHLFRDLQIVEESLSFFPFHQGNKWQYEITIQSVDSTFIRTIEIVDPLTMPNGKNYYDFDDFGFIRVDTFSLSVYQYRPLSDCLNNEEEVFNLIYPEISNYDYETCYGNYFNVLNGHNQVGSLLDSARFINFNGYNNNLTDYVLSEGFGISNYSSNLLSWSLIAAEINGEIFGEFVRIDESDLYPNSFALHQNYPNPFNPVTTLRYELPEKSHVQLVIYDILGREVKELVNGELTSGYHQIIWDGRGNSGKPAGAGLYLYLISAGDFHSVKKMVLLK